MSNYPNGESNGESMSYPNGNGVLPTNNNYPSSTPYYDSFAAVPNLSESNTILVASPNANAGTVIAAAIEDISKPDIAALKNYQELQSLEPSSAFYQLAKTAILLIIDIFRITIACLLSIFVSQLCSPDSTSNVDHQCTFEENFQDLSNFNSFVVVWNFLTLGVMFIQYLLMWTRERFMIEKLMESIVDTRVHLREIIDQYPVIKNRLHVHNAQVFYVSMFGMFMQAVNIVVSAVLVFGYFYNGYQTITGFLTSILLVAGVMTGAASTTYLGLRHNVGYSCTTFTPVSYNTVNPKYVTQ